MNDTRLKLKLRTLLARYRLRGRRFSLKVLRKLQANKTGEDTKEELTTLEQERSAALQEL